MHHAPRLSKKALVTKNPLDEKEAHENCGENEKNQDIDEER